MKRTTIGIRLLPAVLLASVGLGLTACASMGGGSGEEGVTATDLQKSIRPAVYEVVALKPVDTPETAEKKREQGREDELLPDTLEYEEPLAWDSIDYSVRTDEYMPLGTAFAISERELVTAAHVLPLEYPTLLGELFVRDAHGKIYAIEQITKYANNKDFVVFTLEGAGALPHLEISEEYALDTGVYAVGNAYGEGIVVRDGLLTSISKEPQEGEWEYLRFSAAASPGNSGGPLLDSRGRVIGIVLKKSKNENLNYALPITEMVQAPRDRAIYDRSVRYKLLITERTTELRNFTESYQLPMPVEALREELVDKSKEISVVMLDELKERHREHLFPHGEGARELLRDTTAFHFPHIAGESDDDGMWEAYRPKEVESARLSDTGFIEYGSLGYLTMINFRKPQEVSLESLLEEPEAFGEMLLKGYPLFRFMGEQRSRITSMGAPQEFGSLRDRYGRLWLRYVWQLPFADGAFRLYALPVPDGFKMIGFLAEWGEIATDLKVDGEEYLNYIFLTYSGTLPEWKHFMGLREYLPEPMRRIGMEYSEGAGLRLTADEFEFDYGSEVFEISDESSLSLKYSYVERAEEVRWMPVGFILSEHQNRDAFVSLTRHIRPYPSESQEAHVSWEGLLNREPPFDSRSIKNDGNTYIVGVYGAESEGAEEASDVVYSMAIGLEGLREQEAMSEKLENYRSALEVEHEQGSGE